MTLQISHLVVVGCSFAYGDELEDPKTQSWSALLGKKLGVPVVNISSKGAGNDRIQRRLFEYHYLDSENKNYPLYIIAYSHSTRREEYLVEANDYVVVDEFLDDNYNKDYTFARPHVYNCDEKIVNRKKLIIQTSVLNWLKSQNVNYFTTDNIPYNENEKQYLKNNFTAMFNEVMTDSNRLSDFTKLTSHMPKLPGGHDGYEAQTLLADYTFDEIIKRYHSIEVINAPFTTTSEFYDNFRVLRTGLACDDDWIDYGNN